MGMIKILDLRDKAMKELWCKIWSQKISFNSFRSRHSPFIYPRWFNRWMDKWRENCQL